MADMWRLPYDYDERRRPMTLLDLLRTSDLQVRIRREAFGDDERIRKAEDALRAAGSDEYVSRVVVRRPAR